MKEILYGFYSEKLHKYASGSISYLFIQNNDSIYDKIMPVPVIDTGASIYLDENGNEVMVNWVSKNPNKPDAWGDMVYVGKVTKFVKDAPMKNFLDELEKLVKNTKVSPEVLDCSKKILDKGKF